LRNRGEKQTQNFLLHGKLNILLVSGMKGIFEKNKDKKFLKFYFSKREKKLKNHYFRYQKKIFNFTHKNLPFLANLQKQ